MSNSLEGDQVSLSQLDQKSASAFDMERQSSCFNPQDPAPTMVVPIASVVVGKQEDDEKVGKRKRTRWESFTDRINTVEKIMEQVGIGFGRRMMIIVEGPKGQDKLFVTPNVRPNVELVRTASHLFNLMTEAAPQAPLDEDAQLAQLSTKQLRLYLKLLLEHKQFTLFPPDAAHSEADVQQEAADAADLEMHVEVQKKRRKQLRQSRVQLTGLKRSPIAQLLATNTTRGLTQMSGTSCCRTSGWFATHARMVTAPWSMTAWRPRSPSPTRPAPRWSRLSQFRSLPWAHSKE